MNRLSTWPVSCLSIAVLGAALAGASYPSASAYAVTSGASTIAIFESSLPKFSERDDDQPKRWTIAERMQANHVPGAAVAVIRQGEIVLEAGYGTAAAGSETPIDEHTVFSAGSVSKMVNATLILRLVQAGKLELDVDVNQYLKRWQVPNSKHSRSAKVTLRSLLSHTSGFGQHGFGDFLPGEALPSALQTLNGEHPAKHGPVELTFAPGSAMDYSGGGITVSQVLVEDVTGLAYEQAARMYVFEPLGMLRSTFVSPLPEDYGNIAYAHDSKGQRTALPRGYESMPEIAASGLWTSAHDMALLVLALMENDAFLSADLRTDMLTRVPRSWHGLGPRLNGSGDDLVFHHGGANNSYRSWIEGHVAQRDGFIVLTNATDGRSLAYELRLAADVAFDWSISFPEDYAEPQFD